MAEKRRPCAGCGRNRAERFFSSPQGHKCVDCRKKKRQDLSRGVHLRETYGLTLQQYEAILEAQDGKCAICGRTPRYNMDLDHDHKTNLVRGLLCKPCNRRLLPSVWDDVEALRAAVAYLQEPPASRAIGDHRVPDAVPRRRRRRR